MLSEFGYFKVSNSGIAGSAPEFRQAAGKSGHREKPMQDTVITVAPFAFVFGAVVLLMLIWEPPFLREVLEASFRIIPAPLVIFGVCTVFTIAFAAGLAVVVKQSDEAAPFAQLCTRAAAIGESPGWAPLRDSFEMAQIRGECHAPHPPVAEALGYPSALALGLTLLMPFVGLLVCTILEQAGGVWLIPALLISVVLSGFFIGMVLTSKEGLGPLDYACENVANIARSPNWASAQGLPEMVEMRRACGLNAPLT